LDVAMTSPDADEPHGIADTQMFRRFVNEDPSAQVQAQQFWMWKWPGVLLPVIGSIVIVIVVIILLTN
jgi:hypothetical protein